MDSATTRSSFTRRRLLKTLGALSAATLPAVAVRPLAARAEDHTLKVMALGQAVVASDLREPPYGELARVVELLHAADACAVELITMRPPPANAASGAAATARAADPSGLDGLKALGVTMLALANGSSVDVNGGGLGDLVAAARARDLTFAGAGSDLAGANAAGYRTVPAGKVALIAAASGDVRTGVAAGDTRPGINVIPRLPNGQLEPLEIERIASQVHAAAENADVAVVYLQHEAERAGAPRLEWLQRVARRAIESGAGLVVGAGLPQLQGIEIYRNRPIFYGLGSFVLQGSVEAEAEALQALAARCTFDRDTLRQIELFPIQLTGEAAAQGAGEEARPAPSGSRGRPTLADAATSAAILARVAELSRPHNTNVAVADGIGRIAL